VRVRVGVGAPGVPTFHGDSWQALDVKFRRDLPDEAYVGRLAYRGLVMRACPRVRLLDGVAVEGREREKAERLLQGVLGAAPRPVDGGRGAADVRV
jgi:protein NUD1